MSATVEVTTQIDLQGDSSVHAGDKNTPVEVLITNGSVLAIENLVVADNYTVVTPWITGGGGFADFTWGVIFSDKDLLIQFKNSLGTAEYDVLAITANVPFYFGYTNRGRTSNSLTTTVQTTGLGNVVEIKLQNNIADALGDATVDMYLFR